MHVFQGETEKNPMVQMTSIAIIKKQKSTRAWPPIWTTELYTHMCTGAVSEPLTGGIVLSEGSAKSITHTDP